MIEAGTYYGIMISLLFMLFIISLCVSMFRNKRNVKLYSILLRDDGKISKVAVAFLFILPVILYQAIYLKEITAGLDYILLTIFGTELGVKITDKLPNVLNKRNDNKRIENMKSDHHDPYKDL